MFTLYATDDMMSLAGNVTGVIKSITRKLFPDGTPNIFIEGIDEIMRGTTSRDVVYFTQYHTMEQKMIEQMIMHVLADTLGIDRLTIIDLFDPLATMERVDTDKEGTVATANVDAHFWKTLPRPDSGKKIRRVLFDHHTLQNRFFFSGGNTSVVFLSAMPLIEALLTPKLDAVAFPDEGAYKRFGTFFKSKGYDIIVCGKVRVGNQRIVKITDPGPIGVPVAKKIIIIDDLVRSGGTLIACAHALRAEGAVTVNVFVTHAQFPNESWKKFTGAAATTTGINEFITTNTIPKVSSVLADYPETFKVLDVMPLVHDYCLK